MCPPPGSSGHFLAEHQDQGTDVWRPRGPSVEEEETIRRVKVFNKIVQEQEQEQEAKRAKTNE